MDDDDDAMWGVDDVAAFLRVPKMTVYHWRRTGYGPPGVRIGRHVRYRPEDVRSWVQSELDKAE